MLKAESMNNTATYTCRMVLHLKNFPMTYRHACLKYNLAEYAVTYNLGLPLKQREAKPSTAAC